MNSDRFRFSNDFHMIATSDAPASLACDETALLVQKHPLIRMLVSENHRPPGCPPYHRHNPSSNRSLKLAIVVMSCWPISGVNRALLARNETGLDRSHLQHYIYVVDAGSLRRAELFINSIYIPQCSHGSADWVHSHHGGAFPHFLSLFYKSNPRRMMS